LGPFGVFKTELVPHTKSGLHFRNSHASVTTDEVLENECITISMKQEIRAEKRIGVKNIGRERTRTNSVEMSLY